MKNIIEQILKENSSEATETWISGNVIFEEDFIKVAEEIQKQLALNDVIKCPNLTGVWNETVVKQEKNEHNLFVTNECWGALRILEKNGLCKLNKI